MSAHVSRIEPLESRVLLSDTFYVDDVATNGTGTITSPYNSLQSALNNANTGPGDTIYIRAGTYHQQAMVQAGKSGSSAGYLTISSYPGDAAPVLTGSDRVTGWVNYSGNIWKKTGWTVNSQQVFAADGTPLQQIGRPNPPYNPSDNTDEYPDPIGSGLGDMQAGRFYYDPAAQTLYVQMPDNSNPNNSDVEASVRDRVFFAEADRGYEKLDGLIFEHGNASALREQDALVTVGSNTIVTNSTFRYGDFAGLALGLATTGVQVTNSQFLNNGDMGIQGASSSGVLIQNNLVSGNNYRNFNQEWHAGGIEITSTGASAVIKNNEIANNNGSGIWFDSTTGSGNIISGNYVHDNGPLEAGIFFEASHHALISNNVLVNNNHRGIYISGSDDVKVYNNTVYGQQGLAGIVVLARPNPGGGSTNSTNTIVKNNIISNSAGTPDLYLSTGTGNASDYNDVYRSSGAVFKWNGATKTLAQMQALGFETHSIITNPSFASVSGAKLPLSYSSPAKDAGVNLSPDVTTDYAGTLRAQGSAYDMGAYEYSGLVGYWHLDENTGTTTADASGTGNNGSLVNGTSWVSPGQAGAAALSFDGVDDRVTVPDNNTLDISSAITIGGWFKHSSSGGSGTAGVQKLQAYRLTAQEANAATSHWQFFFTDSLGAFHQITTTNAYSNDAWHYVMATYNGAQLQIYVDGLGAATPVSFTGTINSASAQSFQLGQRDATAFYKGQMDEIRLYNRALTSLEIAQIYSSGGVGMMAMQPQIQVASRPAATPFYTGNDSVTTTKTRKLIDYLWDTSPSGS